MVRGNAMQSQILDETATNIPKDHLNLAKYLV
jgi:hypothetical protein